MEPLAHVTLPDLGVIAAALAAGIGLGIAPTLRLLRRQDARPPRS